MENESHAAFSKAEAIIREVKEAEKMAETIIETARKDAEAILQEARINAAEIVRSEEESSQKEQGKKLAEARKTTDSAAEKQDIEKESAALSAKASRNIPKATSLVLGAFEELISHE